MAVRDVNLCVSGYYDCVDTRIVQLFRAVMGIGFVAVVIVLVATVLDMVGVHDGFPKWMRRNSILHIFTGECMILPT